MRTGLKLFLFSKNIKDSEETAMGLINSRKFLGFSF